MTLRHARPEVFRIKGCSDAVDGTNAFPGAMLALGNLVPSPTTQDQWVPRPARDNLTDLTIGFMPFGGTQGTAGDVQGYLIVGDVAYGLVSLVSQGSSFSIGRDVPFCVDLITGQPLPVNGIGSLTSLPTTPPKLGRTQKALFAKVAGRVLVTHPGFPGGLFNPLGFTGTFTGTTFVGQNQVYAQPGVQVLPGMGISDTGGAIPAGTYVFNVSSVDFNLVGTGGAGTTTFTLNGPSNNVVVGMMVAGGNGGLSAYVTAVDNTTATITIDRPITATFTNAVVSFHSNLVGMSANATASVNSDTITVTSIGNPGAKFGWFDISNASIVLPGCTTTSGSTTVTVPDPIGIQPGYLVTGTGIPGNTRVVDIANPNIVVAGSPPVFGQGFLNLNFGTLPGDVPPFTFPIIGQTVTGPGVAQGTTVTAVTTVSQTTSTAVVQVTLSATALGASGASQPVFTFSGVAQVILDGAATASGTVTLTFAGGTPRAPLWGTGDTAINHLPSTPIGVGEFNGRAYFACGTDGIPYTDSLLPGVRTYAKQALSPGNGKAVTHCVGQPLNSPITGGMVQALYAFQGVAAVQQITGDQSTNNLSMNPLNIATGTLAPATITPTTLGMAFVSPEGLRLIDFSGVIGQPIGEAGTGVTIPFVSAVDPTRMVAAANGDVLRISVQDIQRFNRQYEEWWYDLVRRIWSGPHSLQTSWMAPYNEKFITSAIDFPGKLYSSPSFVSGFSDFEEDGATLTWVARTALLPDGQDMAEHALLEATVGMLLPSDQPVKVIAYDESSAIIDSVLIPGNYPLPHWGGPNMWGTGLWYAADGFFRQIQLDWSQPVVFKQMSLQISGTSRFGFTLGNIYMRIQRLGYLSQEYPSVPIAISVPALPGALLVNNSPLALQANASAPQGTVIGAVQTLIGGSGPGLANPILSLVFSQGGLALWPFVSMGITGSTHSNLTIDTFSANPISNGWLIGHIIWDDAGSIPPGTYITGIASNGSTVTLSQPATRSVVGTNINVQGTNLCTDWSSPLILPANVNSIQLVGQIQAQAPGYLTSTWEFIVTVTPQGPLLSADSGLLLTTDTGQTITLG